MRYQHRRRNDLLFPPSAPVHELNYNECLFPRRARVARCKRGDQNRIGDPNCSFVFIYEVDAILVELKMAYGSFPYFLRHVFAL